MGRVAGNRLLRSRLLATAGAVVIVAPMAGMALADDAKWQPWVEAGAMAGTDHSFGDVDILVPVWQDRTSLLFADLRGTFSTEPTQEGNFGLGYRTQLNTDWILGFYGYIDIQNSENDNLYYQGTLGIELLSVDWDFRLNGYVPFNPDGGFVEGKTEVEINGNNIQMRAGEEKALYGFDGEVGWRVPILPADGDMDIRVFAGGYFFTNSDVDAIAGPRGRIEARLYDIDFLGLQSRLTAQGVIQWDQPRGTQGFGGLELRIPLGAVTGNPGPKLNPLDRRMVDRVQRDVDIVTRAGAFGRPEDVIVDGMTVHTHTIVFADGSGGGKGTRKSPLDLSGAVDRFPNANAIIVVEGNAGPINIDNPLHPNSGQALLGGASKINLTGANSGQTVSIHAPGTLPALVGSDSASALIELAPGSKTRISGLSFTGSFHDGIVGDNVSRAIITNNIFTTAGGDGIELNTKLDSGALSQFIKIADNLIEGPGENGISIDSYARGPGTVLLQTVLIDRNTVIGAAYHGIHMLTRAYNGSSATGYNTLNQQVTIARNVIGATSDDGILLKTVAYNGKVSENVFIISNNVTSSFKNALGMDVTASGGDATTAFLLVSVEGNELSGNGSNGVSVDQSASGDAFAAIFLGLAGNGITGNGKSGVFLRNTGTSAEQAMYLGTTIPVNSITGNGGPGVYLSNFAGTQTVALHSTLGVGPNIVNSYLKVNGGGGVQTFAK